jgi:hypothetical protein
VHEQGNWSMMYDQAFFMDLPESDRRFTANFRYTVKSSITPSSYSTLSTGDYDKFDSDCGNTMVGFLESDSNFYQCAFATQTKALN